MSKKRSYDKYIRHQIWLRGQSTRIANAIIEILEKRESDLLSKITTKAFKGPRNLNAVINSVYENIEEIYEEISESLQGELEKLAEFQSSWMLGAIASKKDISVDVSVLMSQVLDDPFDGKLLNEWMSDQSDALKKRVRSTVRQGVIESKSIRDIVGDIQESEKGALRQNRRQTTAMVRTAVNHTVSTADDYVYRKADIKRYQIVAILDSRTTRICAKLDGGVHKIGEAIRPPFHVNCRTFTIPVQSDDDIVTEGYEEWFDRQSPGEQRKILGPARYRLWKNGESLGSFVDSDYHVIPLSDLRAV